MALQQVVKCFLLFLVIKNVSANVPHFSKARKTYEFEGEITPRLLVSPYIKAGRIREARELSLVTGLEPNITSYSGFLTVNEECNSNLFYWFFPSQNDMENDAFTVWLNGGPGNSSLLGLLTENGPYALTMDGKLELREHSWNRNSSVIYIDNPVGTGYSYTDREECYATEQTQVGNELLIALQQFLILFPELQGNRFYITGESYAGKYVPALAYAIHTNKNASNINLKGLAIGNGWIDPINQLNYSSYLYSIGLVDNHLRDDLAELEQEARDAITNGAYLFATIVWRNIMEDFFGYETDFEYPYNYLYNKGEPTPDIAEFVILAEIREALHVGNATFHNYSLVHYKLQADFMKSVMPWFEELLDHYRIVLYNGQLDIMFPYSVALDYIQKMEWLGDFEYKTVPRFKWYVDGELAGYAKTGILFTELLVRNAGQMVPTDQPKWAFDLYNRLIFDIPFRDGLKPHTKMHRN